MLVKIGIIFIRIFYQKNVFGDEKINTNYQQKKIFL